MAYIYTIKQQQNNKTMLSVTLFMQDELNGNKVERTIDGSNLMVPDNSTFGWECNKIGTSEEIESNLNNWIKERGNQQHETLLTLEGWKINK